MTHAMRLNDLFNTRVLLEPHLMYIMFDITVFYSMNYHGGGRSWQFAVDDSHTEKVAENGAQTMVGVGF